MTEPRALPPRPLAGAAWLIACGLLVQTVTLYWSHPTAFLAFLGLGGLLVVAGIARYLWAWVGGPAPRDRTGEPVRETTS